MFTVKKNCDYKDISFKYGGTEIYLGMHDLSEVSQLAIELLGTVRELMLDKFDGDIDMLCYWVGDSL